MGDLVRLARLVAFKCGACEEVTDLDLESLRETLAKAGMHLVTDADMRVLEACRAIEFSYWEGARGCLSESFFAVLDAEHARRESSRG